MTNVTVSIDELEDELVERALKSARISLFVRDITNDVSLLDLIPDGGPILDIVATGERPDEEPAFRTPRTDVYIIGYDTTKAVNDLSDD